MKIVVLLKAIPIQDHLVFDERGYVRREGVTIEMNPMCRRALAKGIELAALTGGTCVAMTMGPPSSAQILLEALAIGVDHAVLLSDPAFSGSDLLATSRALAGAISELGGCDLVLLGKASLDAETGVLPSMIAEHLRAPLFVAARQLVLEGHELEASCETDDGIVRIRGSLPAIVSCAERLISPLRADPDVLVSIAPEIIQVLTASSLPEGVYGGAGSPTSVGEVRALATSRRGVTFTDASAWANQAVAQLDQSVTRHGRTVLHAPARRALTGRPLVVVDVPEMRWYAHELLGAANLLADGLESHIVVISEHDDVVAWSSMGADSLRTLSRRSDPVALSEILGQVVEADQPHFVFLPSTAWGREVAGRLAVRTGCALVTDVADFEHCDGELRLWKSALSNSERVEIRTTTPTTIVTLQAGRYQPVVRSQLDDLSDMAREVTAPLVEAFVPEVMERIVEDDLELLTKSPIVIGIGLGVPPDAYAVVYELADRLDAEVVGTRKLTDRALLPRSRQVGATGRLLSSKVYLAVGISGKPMHVAGINAVGTVLAINSDPTAPMFEHCDLGLIASWEVGIEALNRALDRCGWVPGRTGALTGHLHQGSEVSELTSRSNGHGVFGGGSHGN